MDCLDFRSHAIVICPIHHGSDRMSDVVSGGFRSRESSTIETIPSHRTGVKTPHTFGADRNDFIINTHYRRNDEIRG